MLRKINHLLHYYNNLLHYYLFKLKLNIKGKKVTNDEKGETRVNDGIDDGIKSKEM
jgi:hypothetical protein